MKRKILIFLLTAVMAACLGAGLAACSPDNRVTEPPAPSGSVTGTGEGTEDKPYRPDTSSGASVALELNEAGTEYTVTGAGRLAGSEAVVIPASYDGKPVTAIADDAFKMNTAMTSLTIPSSIKSIGVGAFVSCLSLTVAIIPDSVTSLGDEVFNNCTSLLYVSLGKGIKSIPAQAFLNCTSLEAVNEAGKVKFSNDVKEIGSQAFEGCTAITALETGGVATIGDHAFYNCTSLTDVNLALPIRTICSFAFGGCTAITELVVPQNTTKIEISAFEKCSAIQKITLPFVGESAYKAPDPDDAGESNFFFSYIFGAPNRGSNYGNNSQDGTEYTDKYLPSVLKTVIINGGGTIDSGAFNYCYNIETLILGSGVTELSAQSLYNMMGLKSIVIPRTVRSIGYAAFLNCSMLTKVYYQGTQAQWNTLDANTDYENGANDHFSGAIKYFYSQNNPFTGTGSVTTGNFWHFDEDGNIAEWSRT